MSWSHLSTTSSNSSRPIPHLNHRLSQNHVCQSGLIIQKSCSMLLSSSKITEAEGLVGAIR